MIRVDICATCCILGYMRHCVKCQAVIKTKAFIDGKERNLQRRKYCLECSPFGAHNTKADIEQPTLKGSIVKCLACSKSYLYTHKGQTILKCSTCHSRERRQILKQKSVTYKGGCCERCGYNKCLGALDFHHKDPSIKDFGLGAKTTSRPWIIIKLELDKCLCLCANCHREVHEELIKEKYSTLAQTVRAPAWI